MDVLIDPDELLALVESGTPPRILDVRWRLDKPDGHDDHRGGYLPGAVYVDLDGELAERGDPEDGRHPLPSVERLQAAARRWGIDDGDAIVVYDDLGGMSAARAWWLLRHAGLTDVRLLDGGLRAWRGAIEAGDVVPEPGSVTLRYGALPVIDIDGAAGFDGVLLDARAPERFRGEVEPVDPRAGHIPGAVNAPPPATSTPRAASSPPTSSAPASRRSGCGTTWPPTAARG